MSHVDDMVNWFLRKNRKATLGQIQESGEKWAYEFRARMVDARKKGFHFRCVTAKTPSENLYLMDYSDGNQMRFI